MPLLIILMLFAQTLFSQSYYAQRVNPFVGTDGHGHTFPGAVAPFGMVQLSPDTRVEGWDACGGYHYSDSTILGFSHTHLSGTGVPDYGDILFMPMAKRPSLDPRQYRSAFSHAQESASAGYYHVLLLDDSISVDLTATTRTGIHRYRFPKADTSYVIVDLKHGLGPDVVIESWMEQNGKTEITGFRRSRGWANDQHLYFVAQFSLPVIGVSITSNDSIAWKHSSSTGTNVKAALMFNTKKKNELIIKVALSSVSADGARKNLRVEAPEWNFETIAKRTQKEWNSALSAIAVAGGTEPQQRTFYTALYHCMIAPNTFSDVDGRYRGMNGIILTAKDRTHYSVFSLWDTFRALHPLLTIVDPKRASDFIKTFLAQYDESGLLPVWELCSNETNCMIGYHSVSVIADAIAKNIGGFDREKALQAMLTSAGKDHFGLKYYRSHGYVPGEKESESVSKTLEYAYDDWCIARTAELLGKTEIAGSFYIRSQNFRNVFDPASGFMRGKKNGMWNEPFSPAAVSLDFTEANSWQYSFFVPQDIPGMIELYGGREAFIQKLNELFTTSNKLEGRQQSDITGLIGQYAHGNEPSHHMAYLYTYAGDPSKTQQRTRQIMDELYSDRPDGLSGNEDCGQMSAWYVMSAMGFYQVVPGLPEYTLTAPIFDSIVIRSQSKHNFIVRTRRNSSADRYIQSVTKNNTPLNELFFTHSDIVNGSLIDIQLGPNPSGTYDNKKIFSESKSIPFTAVPFFSSRSLSFVDSAVVSIHTPEKDSKILFTVNGTDPTLDSPEFLSPLVIRNTSVIRAIAVRNTIQSAPAEASFIKTSSVGALTLQSRYSDQYTAGGDNALIDGIYGVEDFRVGHWQGYEQNDLDAVLDLKTVRHVGRIGVRFLQDNNAWIFFPTSVEYAVSADGIVYEKIFSGTTGIPPQESGAIIKSVEQKIDKQIRYIRITAKNIGMCPPWHKGSGSKAWLFADEIIVQ